MTAPTKHPARRALALIQAEPWAITSEALAQIIEIAARENRSLEALEAELGEPLANTYEATIRDGIATIRLTGAFFRYANLFTRVSGATSLQSVAPDLTAAIKDSRVQGIILAIDSPGGTVSGTSEFADLIYQARDQKRIVAHIDGLGASAAYWIASAAARITASDTSIVGSIGVVMAERLQDDTGIIEFVSSQSPRKRTSPTDELGRADRQAIVDALGERFLEVVARHRAVELDRVRAEFGQGGVFVGQAAADAGMVDAISTYEQVHADLVQETRGGAVRVLGAARFATPMVRGAAPENGRVAAHTEESQMADSKNGQPATLTAEQLTAQYPEQVAAIRAAARTEGEAAGREAGKGEGRAEGITAENARIQAIEALTVAGHEAVITACKKDSACTPEMAAVKLVQAQQAKASATAAAGGDARSQRLELLRATEKNEQPPAAAPTDTPAENADAAAVQRILGTAQALRAPAPSTARRS